MKAQYIKLLKKQIAKLDDPDFDLEAWKTGTITVLHRIFGENDPRAKQIENLKIDYSSWALRDSNANYKPVETAKRKGKEILITAIDEMEVFGMPDHSVSEILGQEFVKKLQEMSMEERKKYFEGMKKGELVALLMRLAS
jgi:hypothetical protein